LIFRPTDQLGIVLPLAVHAELVLMVALWQIDDGHKVLVAPHHGDGLPVGEGARDGYVLAAAIPPQNGGKRRLPDVVVLAD